MQVSAKFIFSAIIGAILEFYDFILYGIFASVIALVFFPKGNPQIDLMASLAVLAVGYFMRPLGGLLFGHFGDKYSRRRALTASLIIMGVATTAMGLLPGYQAWGITATIILVLLRMLQGLMTGGEMGGAMVFLFENAPPKHKALISTMCFVGAMMGILLAISVAALLTHYYTTVEIQQYAWRIPFIIGILLAIVGSYLRLTLWQDNMTETVAFPALELLKTHWREILIAILFLSMAAMFSGIVSVYLVPYLTIYNHYNLQAATDLELYITIAIIVSLILGSLLADYWQRYRAWLLIGTLVLTLSSYPLFLIAQYNLTLMPWMLMVFTILGSLTMSVEVIFLANLFEKHIRYSGMGFAHGLAFSLLGGTAPLLLNYVIIHWGIAAPGLLFSITALLAFCAVLLARKNSSLV